MPDSPTPLLSVVIPTRRRPRFLRRAIDSALQSAPDGDSEVVVVPNGPDESWKAIAETFKAEKRVQWHTITVGHANVARNHGMALARGKYVRFLDDDDVIYPDAASVQIDALEQSGADICSGSLEMSNDAGEVFGTWLQPDTTDDFIAAMCSNRRMLQVTAHVLRRELARTTTWDETLPYSQDIAWFLDIAKAREIKWKIVDHAVGCWHRHTTDRISTHASIHHRRQIICDRLIALSEVLEREGRLTNERRAAISTGVWEQIHHALCFSPAYWFRIARWVRFFDPGSRPAIPLFENKLALRINPDPLFVELCIAPYRLVRHVVKRTGHLLGMNSYW